MATLLMTLFISRGEGQVPKFTLSRQEISEMAGVAQETVIRIISEFKSDGLIKSEGKNIVVLKPDELRKTAGIFEI